MVDRQPGAGRACAYHYAQPGRPPWTGSSSPLRCSWPAWGYAQGLIVGALSLAGFAAGAFLGSRLGPQLLEEGAESPYAPLTALIGAVLMGGILASIFELLGFRLRGGLGRAARRARRCRRGRFWPAWAFGLRGWAVRWPQHPGATELREPIQRSEILRSSTIACRRRDRLIQALARFDPFPEIAGPEADVPPPTRRSPATPMSAGPRQCGEGARHGVRARCPGQRLGGCGPAPWSRTPTWWRARWTRSVQLRGEGESEDAQAIWFDPRNDLAILRGRPERRMPAAHQRERRAWDRGGAILGFPSERALRRAARPAGLTSTVITQDAYGRGPVERTITSVRGRVRSGNSGGPVVDAGGRVLTTIFAASVSDSGGSGFGVPDSIVGDALRRAVARWTPGPARARASR